MLIEAGGANVENVGRVGLPPILIACQHKAEASAVALLDVGQCDPNPTAARLGLLATDASIQKHIAAVSIVDGHAKQLRLQEARIAVADAGQLEATLGGSPTFTPIQVCTCVDYLAFDAAQAVVCQKCSVSAASMAHRLRHTLEAR